MSFSWSTLQRTASWMPTILDSFYITITNDHIGVEVRGGGEPQKWWVLPHVEFDTTRRSHPRPIWSLNVTNSRQFDGQAFWPVVWWFPAGWVLVYSCHRYLKTTWALKHVRQVLETSPRKSRPGKQLQWYTHGLLVHWCINQVVVKSQPCHCVCGSRLLSNPVTYNKTNNWRLNYFLKTKNDIYRIEIFHSTT